MLEIAVVSGKGGTGKTSVTAAFATLIKSKVLADCDVDAPDLHLILKPRIKQSSEFYGMKRAYIRLDDCTWCGICREYCRFDAISEDYVVDPIACDGCELCYHLCPEKAIDLNPTLAGHWYVAESRFGTFVYGMLEIGEENSGKLVTVIRKQGLFLAQKEGADFLLVDGPPGTGCPVNSTLSGLKYAFVVTEPTQSGLHDLGRIIDLMEHFKVYPLVVVNKFDLNEEVAQKIERYVEERGGTVLGKIPFDPAVTESMTQGLSVIEYGDSPASKAIKEVWEKFMSGADL